MRKTSKLRLSPEDLHVESFATAAAETRGAGTVHANQLLTRDLRDCWTVGGATCENVYTCPECASPPWTDFDCDPPVES